MHWYQAAGSSYICTCTLAPFTPHRNQRKEHSVKSLRARARRERAAGAERAHPRVGRLLRGRHAGHAAHWRVRAGRRPCGTPARPRGLALTASPGPAPRCTTVLPTACGLMRMRGMGWRLWHGDAAPIAGGAAGPAPGCRRAARNRRSAACPASRRRSIRPTRG